MTKEIMLQKLIKDYDRFSYTHNYIFGFEDNGVIYAATATAEILPYVCYVDVASRNGGYSLRFKPTKAQKEILKACRLEVVCSAEYFEEIAENSKYNRGEIFEKIITEKHGQVWQKDQVPFWEDGDLTINGIAYQIKFNKATFTSEKQLLRLGA